MLLVRVPVAACRYRLGVRTRGSQPRDRGSNPRTGTNSPNTLRSATCAGVVNGVFAVGVPPGFLRTWRTTYSDCRKRVGLCRSADPYAPAALFAMDASRETTMSDPVARSFMPASGGGRFGFVARLSIASGAAGCCGCRRGPRSGRAMGRCMSPRPTASCRPSATRRTVIPDRHPWRYTS